MQPSHEERTYAALAHASVIANITGLIGLITAAVIWATQRQRSRYIASHALQALWYQAGVVLGMLVLLFSWGGCITLALLPKALRPELYSDGTLPGPFWLALSTILIAGLFGLLTTIYGLFAALQAYQGRPFHYPFMRRLAEREAASPIPAPELPSSDTASAELDTQPQPTAADEPIATPAQPSQSDS